MKIRTVEAKLFRADGHTDGGTQRHDEANSRFLEILRTRLERTNTLHWDISAVYNFSPACFGPSRAVSMQYKLQGEVSEDTVLPTLRDRLHMYLRVSRFSILYFIALE